MQDLVYRIVRNGDHWSITRDDGTREGEHTTKEGAFEAAVAAASNAIRDGYSVHIFVPKRDAEPSLAPANGRPYSTTAYFVLTDSSLCARSSQDLFVCAL
jgi:hypothetical protein